MFAVLFAVVGYVGLLSLLLNTDLTSVYQAQKKLTGFRQTLVNVGLLAVLAFTAMIIVLSYMKHFGIKD
jgi:Na+/melibiose symporter-like transporter